MHASARAQHLVVGVVAREVGGQQLGQRLLRDAGRLQQRQRPGLPQLLLLLLLLVVVVVLRLQLLVLVLRLQLLHLLVLLLQQQQLALLCLGGGRGRGPRVAAPVRPPWGAVHLLQEQANPSGRRVLGR